MNAERNKQLRQRADAIALWVSKAIGLKAPPKCARITRRRGHGYDHAFSVPVWAAVHDVFFAYYVAHEVCHAHPTCGKYHDESFRQVEGKALASMGLKPVYENEGCGPYVTALADMAGNLVCVYPRRAAGPEFVGPTDPPTVRVQR